jgi:hypothetical protein
MQSSLTPDWNTGRETSCHHYEQKWSLRHSWFLQQLDVPCSDSLLFQAFSPARAPLRSDAALLLCTAGDGVTGLALVEAVRMGESRLMLADNDDLF